MDKSRRQHVHSECEIYINVTGDVSFMVENTIYPISSGDVIISRPFEAHHCIYHSDAPHRHFWILFSCEGNEELFDVFFKREKGKNNLIVLEKSDRVLLVDTCRALEKTESKAEQLELFLRLIRVLGKGKNPKSENSSVSPEILGTVYYINNNLHEKMSVKTLAERVHMSVNSFERNFKKSVGMAPNIYITQKRLAYAANLLRQNYSVKQVCEQSGFSDYSHFINVFGKNFGVTPLAYKKQNQTFL